MKNQSEKTKDQIKEEMIRHIKGHNKFFTDDYLNELTIQQLRCEVHPLYTDYFNNLLKYAKV